MFQFGRGVVCNWSDCKVVLKGTTLNTWYRIRVSWGRNLSGDKRIENGLHWTDSRMFYLKGAPTFTVTANPKRFDPLKGHSIRYMQSRPNLNAKSLFGIFVLAVACAMILVYIIVCRSSRDSEDQLLMDNSLGLLGLLPTRVGSHIWGYISHSTIPECMRRLVFRSYCILFGCNMEEVTGELEDYESLNGFFTRRIPISKRPLSSAPLASPVDGTVLEVRSLEEEVIGSIKGVNYRVQTLIGRDMSDGIIGKNLSYVVIYLAPGDYHGIHSPCDWRIENVRHYSGHLFGVSPFFSKLIDNVLSVNERVVISGQWEHGFFSVVPVGAYNVGSISLEFDPSIKTNQWDKSKHSPAIDYKYDNLQAQKGELISFFNMGSTVVLILETPHNWLWSVKPNDRVLFGQELGRLPH